MNPYSELTSRYRAYSQFLTNRMRLTVPLDFSIFLIKNADVKPQKMLDLVTN